MFFIFAKETVKPDRITPKQIGIFKASNPSMIKIKMSKVINDISL